MVENTQSAGPTLTGWWSLDEVNGAAADLSGNNRPLTPIGGPAQVSGGKFGGGYALNGETQWLTTTAPVVLTHQSFSVAAWVRLDSATVGSELTLKPDWYAVTAVSQDGAEQSPFYLGARLIDNPPKSGQNFTLRWSFTVAPPTLDADGPEWARAHSQEVIDVSELDQWVLLVGVYDLETQTARIYVPGNNDSGSANLAQPWPVWYAIGGLKLGGARYQGEMADMWPGSVGQLRVYSGCLTPADAERLYSEDKLADE